MYKVRGAVRDCKAKSPRDVMLVRMRPHDFHRDAPAGAVLGLRLLQRRVLGYLSLKSRLQSAPESTPCSTARILSVSCVWTIRFVN